MTASRSDIIAGVAAAAVSKFKTTCSSDHHHRSHPKSARPCIVSAKPTDPPRPLLVCSQSTGIASVFHDSRRTCLIYVASTCISMLSGIVSYQTRDLLRKKGACYFSFSYSSVIITHLLTIILVLVFHNHRCQESGGQHSTSNFHPRDKQRQAKKNAFICLD